MQSLPDEKKILEESCSFGGVTASGRIILTSKRLVIFQKKGFIKKSYKKLVEIPLEEIAECFTDVSALEGCRMKFRLTDGEEGMVRFPTNSSQLFLGTMNGMVQSQKAHTDRWVNAINMAKNDKEKSETQDPLKLLQLRLAKGEISIEEYEVLKKLLEE